MKNSKANFMLMPTQEDVEVARQATIQLIPQMQVKTPQMQVKTPQMQGKKKGGVRPGGGQSFLASGSLESWIRPGSVRVAANPGFRLDDAPNRTKSRIDPGRPGKIPYRT